MQILWINMTTAVALGLMLAFEPAEPGLMQRPPRDPHQPVLTQALIGRIVLVSAIMLVGRRREVAAAPTPQRTLTPPVATAEAHGWAGRSVAPPSGDAVEQ